MKSTKNILQNASFLKEARADIDQYKQAILQNKSIQLFLNQHSSQVTTEMIHHHLSKLNEFIEQTAHCEKCVDYSACSNMMHGFRPELQLDRGQIELHYLPCEKEIVAENKRKIQRLIHTVNAPLEIRQAKLTELDAGAEGRELAVKKILQHAQEATNCERKGLYFHGPFGTGKTFLLGVLANKFAEQGIASYIVYWPDFLRELKGSFENNTANQKVNSLREVSVLMIDDIGAEAMSPWVRDEVLGTILQYRMQQKLPTYFTSNFNFAELEQHLTGGQEAAKARRLMERIKFLAEPVEVAGENRRN